MGAFRTQLGFDMRSYRRPGPGSLHSALLEHPNRGTVLTFVCDRSGTV